MKQALTYLICLFMAVNNFAQDGALDNTFSGDGKATTVIKAGADDYCFALAIQTDDRIVTAGYSYDGGYDIALARFNSDGTLDTGFDGDGIVTTAVGSGADYGYSIAIQSDGKIVVAGCSYNGSNYDFALVRYNSDGTLDTGFDGDGMVTTAIGSGGDVAYGVAIQSDQKIVAAGYSYNGTNNDFAVVRYNTNGSLDNTFDTDGKVTTAVTANNDWGRDVAIHADGQIVVAGYSSNPSYYDFALVRYNTNGSLDNTFDSDGKVVMYVGSYDDKCYSVCIQSDSKILLAGSASDGTYFDYAVIRFNYNGSLDAGFGFSGKYTASIRSYDDIGYDIAIQSDGKIVIVGSSSDGSTADYAIIRLNTSGSIDTGFDSDGKVTTAIDSYEDVATSVGIQSDGKIVVGGYFMSGSNYTRDFAAVRYSNASLPVELISFAARISDENVILNWQTATEVNNYGFEIERAANLRGLEDGNGNHNLGGFKLIGFVEGSGNSNSIKEYSFTDKDIISGNYSYRLKQIDIDGSFTYSGVVEVTFNLQPSTFELYQNYPNPFNPTTTIRYAVPTVETGYIPSLQYVTLKIYDILGSEVTTLVNEQKSPGYYEVEFDASRLSSGVYFYRIVTGNFVKTKSMLLVK
ncbi:MAG: T9SS type A sorting domain-containing protein [bacterium]